MGQKRGCWEREDARGGADRPGQRVKGQWLREVSRVPTSLSFCLSAQEQRCGGRGHPPPHPLLAPCQHVGWEQCANGTLVVSEM